MPIAEKITRAKTDYDEVYEAGKKAEYDAFWDDWQQNGTRTDYRYAFYQCSDKHIRSIKHLPLNPTRVEWLFAFSTLSGVIDVDEIIADWSGITSNDAGHNIFTSSLIEEIKGTIDYSHGGVLNSTFQWCNYLKKIEKIKLGDGSYTTVSGVPFNWCSLLEEVEFDGKIAGNSISFQYSPLTLESATSVINALKDYSGTDKAFVYSVTFSSTTKTLLDNAGAIFNGLTWIEHLTAIGWNS